MREMAVWAAALLLAPAWVNAQNTAPTTVLTTAQASAPVHAAADSLPAPAGVVAGDAVRGAHIVASRQLGLCVLCHAVPAALGVPTHTQGNLAPPLDGVGARFDAGQLRLRMVDSRRVNPGSVMPPYGVVPSDPAAARVGSAWRGKPVLDAQQIEDVVAYLTTLR